MTPSLQISGLSKGFGGVPVIAGMDLVIRRGEAFGLIGANGSGKSTLLELIAGTTRPDCGTMLLDGQDLAGVVPWRRARLGVGRCFQESRLWLDMSVLEHLLTVSESLPHRPPARELAVATGLADSLLDRQPQTLSLLQRRRLELALGACAGTHLLLVDELGAGLHLDEAHQLHDCAARLLRDGFIGAVILVEHRLELLTSHVGSVGLLREGRVERAERADRDSFDRVMRGLLALVKEPMKEAST